MKKRILSVLLLTFLLVSLLPTTALAAQNEITVYNWGQYISDGTDDSMDVIKEFEAETGIKVNYLTFDSNESMYTKLKTGGTSYDVIIPSDYMIAKLISEDMLEPIDFANTPNYQYIDEAFRDQAYDPENKYSVPYNLIGERVDIRVTKTTVEIFYHGSRVASHRRLQTRQRDPMVKREHMPPEHQKYLTYNADEFSRWAMSVGPMTEKVAEHFLKSGKAAEQGYKACAGLTKLEQRYGKQRLEAACGKALAYSTAPSLRPIASILKNGLDKPDKAESQLSQSKANSYGITRGAAYFRKGGDR